MNIKMNNIKIPENISGIVCPYRIDFIQTECFNCDFCGRNEAMEHGEMFQKVKVSNLQFYEGAIDTNDSTIEGNYYTFKYGSKTIQIDISLLPEWCGTELSEIHQIISIFRNQNFYKMEIDYDEYDIIYKNNGVFIIIDDKKYGPLSITADHAVMILISGEQELCTDLKTFVHLIGAQEEITTNWEDIYGYDI